MPTSTSVPATPSSPNGQTPIPAARDRTPLMNAASPQARDRTPAANTQTRDRTARNNATTARDGTPPSTTAARDRTARNNAAAPAAPSPPPAAPSRPQGGHFSVRIRLPLVRDLAVRGYTRAEIARTLGVSPRTISADIARLAKLQDQEFSGRVGTDGRLHALDVHRLVQESAWKAVDAILDNQTDTYRNLAPLLRVVALSQAAADEHLAAALAEQRRQERLADWKLRRGRTAQDRFGMDGLAEGLSPKEEVDELIKSVRAASSGSPDSGLNASG